MKTAQADILILPGLGGGTDNHWYERWRKKLKTARRVEQDNWQEPSQQEWCANVTYAVEQAERPVVLVAHSMGVLTAINASASFPHNKVAGAYLVGFPDLEHVKKLHPDMKTDFTAPLNNPLTFPSILVASTNDPYCKIEVAENLAYTLGSKFENAGESGHINPDSGQGPWPEGLLSFANFMATL